MTFVVFYAKRLAFPVWEEKGDSKQVVLCVDSSVVTERKWPVKGRIFDWSPEIDNLKALCQQFRGISSRHVAVNAGNRR